MAIESWDRDAPTDRLELFLERALERGVRDVDVTVQHLVAHASATYGVIHDRRVCVLRTRLSDLLGTRTYEELVNRALP